MFVWGLKTPVINTEGEKNIERDREGTREPE